MKDRSPFVLGLQVDEVFRVAESSRVGSIVGRASLRDNLGDLGERGEDIARLLSEVRAFRLAYAVGHRTARPNSAFVQMRQELRANDTAERQEKGDGQRSQATADYDQAVLDSPAQTAPVAFDEKDHHRILPLRHLTAEQEAG